MKKEKEKTWSDISLKQAQELISLKPEDFKDSDALAYEVEILSILLDMDPTVIESEWSASKIIEELSKWNFINELPKEHNSKLVDTFKMGSKRFGLCKFDELSLAQMVDIEEYVNLGLIENIHNIMAVLYLPVKKYNLFTKKYELEPYKWSRENAELFLDMDMKFVYGNLIFFYRIVTIYTQNMQVSLTEMAQEKLKEMMKMREDQLQSQTQSL